MGALRLLMRKSAIFGVGVGVGVDVAWMTLVVTLAVWLPAIKLVVDETLAVLTMAKPDVLGSTTVWTVMVTMPPMFKTPTVPVKVLPLISTLPPMPSHMLICQAPLKVTPGGRTSRMITFWANAGPVLVTTMV